MSEKKESDHIKISEEISDLSEATLDNFRILAESSLDAILLGIASGKHVFANKTASKITGYSIEELTSKIGINELAAPSELDKIKKNFSDRMSGKTLSKKYETIIIHKRGNRVPIELTAAKIKWCGQTGVIVFFRDISNRKYLESELNISETRLRAAMDCIPFEFLVRDINGICLMQNKISQLHWGSLLDKTIENSKIESTILKSWQKNITRALGGEEIDEEISILNQNMTKTYRNIITPVVDNNNIIGIQEINIDITDQKKAELIINNSQSKLEMRVKKRTMELEKLTQELKDEIIRRKDHEKEVDQITIQLKSEHISLERKTIALEELINHIQTEKEEIKSQISKNINKMIMPNILRIKSLCSDSLTLRFVKLETDLMDVCSPFIDSIENKNASLTPREIEICQFVKNGSSTKEIAATLGISEQTVFKQRKNIRKKLNIPHKVNLVSYLKSLDIN